MKSSLRTLNLLSILLLVLAGNFRASAARPSEPRPFLSPLFTDNMVFQRDMPCPLWGWVKPGERVTVSVQGKSVQDVADAQGKWTVRLQPMPAGGPYDIAISGSAAAMTLRNVLFGDVWICSGQSNMEFGIGKAANAQSAIASATNSSIRLFLYQKQVGLEPKELPAGGKWEVCAPATIRVGGWEGFSAVGYFFGSELQQDLKIPIGLIETAWGGTPAEAWTNETALKTLPDYAERLKTLDETRDAVNAGTYDYAKVLADWYKQADPGGEGYSAADFDASGWKTITLPKYWRLSGDPALASFNGIVWFRREFDIPSDAAGKAVVLHLGPIDNADTTWINGTQIGQQEGPTPRKYPIPSGLLKPGRNIIAVRILNSGGPGGIGSSPTVPSEMSIEIPGTPALSLAGSWSYQTGAPLAKIGRLPVRLGNHVTQLFNGMVAPLIPFAIKGVIWYQGEANSSRAFQYRTLLPAMIAGWRESWGEGAFPFLIVQLANYGTAQPVPGESDWAEVREAQWLASRTVPDTALVTAIDVGGTDIHPTNKLEVGHRLALAARNLVYKENVIYSGPAYQGMQVEGTSIRVKFTNADGGLTAKDGKPLTGFAIAGADRKFVWADAKIDGNYVLVSSPQVPEPVAVRYGWAHNPVCNLYNGAGLPAFPFRTDDWPGITVNNK